MDITIIENSFELTPRLISSPTQILFLPFDMYMNRCYCGQIYSNASLSQKFCKDCLLKYIENTPNFSKYLDINEKYLGNLFASERNFDQDEQRVTYYYDSLYFKQIVTTYSFNLIEDDFSYLKTCQLCNLCNNKQNNIICPNCYLISFIWVTSTSVPILYLPWWDACSQCIICDQLLGSKSHCQKWCSDCLIFYTGCRYCLTTNIIFGITKQSQCMKCKRMSFISIDIPDMMTYILKLNTHNYNKIANYVKNIDKHSDLLKIYSFLRKLNYFSLSVLENLIEKNENSSNFTVPLMFIPFRNDVDQCYCCKSIYSETLLFKQKYCKNCLNRCIDYSTSSKDMRIAIDNLDVCMGTIITNCDKHKPRNLYFCMQNIQEWCENCSEILCFKQIVTNNEFNSFNVEYYHKFDFFKMKYYWCFDFSNYWKSNFSNMKHFCKNKCKLCGKLVYRQNDNITKLRLCSNCYSISFEFIESTLNKNHIPILHLPWWDAYNQCIICNRLLELKSNCQKWCSHCFIVYIGCRYCLTTSIIFGNNKQSKCMKCKRISFITINNMSDMANIKEYFIKFNTHSFNQIANYVKNIDRHSNLLEIYSFIKKLNYFPLSILYFHIANLVENNESSLNLTIPIIFIPFNINENQCYCCRKIYSETPLFKQKYCKNCLYWCIKYATIDLDIKHSINNLDICIRTTNTNYCNKHEPRNLDLCIQDIQKWCENCTEILYFKQIITNQKFTLSKMNHIDKNNCRICGKLIYNQNDAEITKLKLCPDCYSISFEIIESTLTKNYIPILHLPWWDACNECIICNQSLESKTNCQKWCLYCSIIYIGCRHCLTTNIIFVFTNQLQCKRCKRIVNISCNSITGNNNVDEFLYFTRININIKQQLANYININNNNFNPLEIYHSIKRSDCFSSKLKIEWIPYSQITDLVKIAEGGYGKIYKASINENIVAVKEFLNSQDPSKYFLNEVIFKFKIYYLKYTFIVIYFYILDKNALSML
jgi:hypothetical protein